MLLKLIAVLCLVYAVYWLGARWYKKTPMVAGLENEESAQ